jgi:tetratricopeptide (TPR) repeat protein
MRDHSRLFRFGATCLVGCALALGPQARAQTAGEISPAKSPPPEKLSQAELLESYRQLREQLHTAELAILNNRLEAEAAASARTAAITEKLDALRLAMAGERERRQSEAQQIAVEFVRQQAAAQDMNRTVLWLVVTFGGAGLLALFAITLLQWRGNKSVAKFSAQLQPLPDPRAWLPAGSEPPGNERVALSNQRMLSVIDRMERRILELEHTVIPPASAVPVEPDSQPKPVQSPSLDAAQTIQTARIAALLAQGRSLLNAKKAGEAAACYDEILSLDARHPEALVKKGTALEQLHQDSEALECYDRAIEADGGMALAYLSKGGLCVRLERFEEALECYEGALQAGKADQPTGVARRVSVMSDWTAPASPRVSH